VVQWLRLRASTAGSMGSVPSRGSSTCCEVQPKKIKNEKIKTQTAKITHGGQCGLLVLCYLELGLDFKCPHSSALFILLKNKVFIVYIHFNFQMLLN